MATQKLVYVELKSGHNDDGPAWIGRAAFSKSGRTVYFNGRALKRGSRGDGNHFCVESGDGYWVSGVKRTGQDRHRCGTGPVMIDARVVVEYLALRGLDRLDPWDYRVVTDIRETDVSRFHELENDGL